ncbi:MULTISPECIES: hypothetical protein [unclassified Microcoleus]
MKIEQLFVGIGIRLYARLSQRGFDIIPALLPELILFLNRTLRNVSSQRL